MAPSGKGSAVGHWGINNVAALVLALVGILHTSLLVRDDSSLPMDISLSEIPASDGMDFSSTAIAKPGTARKDWERMRDDDL